ncbi:MAG: OmpA family protein [Bacteroidota bacterium]
MNWKNIALSLLLMGATLHFAFGQEKANFDRHAVAAKVLAVDYGTLNDADASVTAGLEIYYRYRFARNFGVAVPLKIGVADVVDDSQNRNITSFDALLHIYPLSGEQKLQPYLLGGVGYVFENTESGNTQIPLGAGVNYMLGPNSYLSLQGEYRSSELENRDNLQFGAGYLYQFGVQDTDGDGIADSDDGCPEIAGPAATAGCPDADNDGVANKDDDCPTEPGTVATMGCPDRDADGIVDTQDQCPELAGLPELEGCPDSDGDGLIDPEDDCPQEAGLNSMRGCPDSDGDQVHDGIDECPDEAGLVSLNGCPGADRDGDDITDDVDRCPDVKGTAATQGCPDTDGDGVADQDDRCPEKAGPYTGCPDTDGDGVIDADDRCPEEAGLTTNKGCPEIEEEVQDVLNLAMRAVQFETGSAVIKEESYNILDQIGDILKRYPAYQLRISGHTDNVGDETINLELSEARAAACYEYLLLKGARATKMSYAGFGEDYPIAPNSTATGRTLNRRVEFDLIIQ